MVKRHDTVISIHVDLEQLQISYCKFTDISEIMVQLCVRCDDILNDCLFITYRTKDAFDSENVEIVLSSWAFPSIRTKISRSW